MSIQASDLWTRTHQTFSHLPMPLQRMLAGAGGGIPDLNCAVTAPGGDGRRILVEGYGIDRTPSKLRRLKKKINFLGLGLLAVLVQKKITLLRYYRRSFVDRMHDADLGLSSLGRIHGIWYSSDR